MGSRKEVLLSFSARAVSVETVQGVRVPLLPAGVGSLPPRCVAIMKQAIFLGLFSGQRSDS